MAEFHPSGNYLCHIRQPLSSTATSWQSPQPDSHRSVLISLDKILNFLLARIHKHHCSHRKIFKINVTKNQLLTSYCSTIIGNITHTAEKLQIVIFHPTGNYSCHISRSSSSSPFHKLAESSARVLLAHCALIIKSYMSKIIVQHLSTFSVSGGPNND